MIDKPLIAEIKRYSLEDGPGIRSVVFFKGCPLRCLFCHNPEMQDARVEIAYMPTHCIACGRCTEACPEHAIDLKIPGHIEREHCTRCGECVEACPAGALKRRGQFYPVEPLTELLLRDSAYYRHSGGGVTLSGGECTLYPDYVQDLCTALQEYNIPVVIQTAGHFEYEAFKRKILPYVQMIFFDMKMANPEGHRHYIGITNEAILDNLRRLNEEARSLVCVRIPLIPGINTDPSTLSALVDLIWDAGTEQVALLPYNPLGLEKAATIGKSVPPLPKGFMEPEEERRLFDQFEQLIDEKRKLVAP